MKKSTKILVVALAVVMVFAFATTAFAAYSGSWSSFPVRSTAQVGGDYQTTRLIQRCLYVYNYNQGVNIDGQYGSSTANAVRSFQYNKGLTQDGVTGSVTWNALYNTTYDQGRVNGYDYRGGYNVFGGATGNTVAGKGVSSGYWYWVSTANTTLLIER